MLHPDYIIGILLDYAKPRQSTRAAGAASIPTMIVMSRPWREPWQLMQPESRPDCIGRGDVVMSLVQGLSYIIGILLLAQSRPLTCNKPENDKKGPRRLLLHRLYALGEGDAAHAATLCTQLPLHACNNVFMAPRQDPAAGLGQAAQLPGQQL